MNANHESEGEPLRSRLFSWIINGLGFALDPIGAMIFWNHPANQRPEWWPSKKTSKKTGSESER